LASRLKVAEGMTKEILGHRWAVQAYASRLATIAPAPHGYYLFVT
jgi:hypothetical protein